MTIYYVIARFSSEDKVSLSESELFLIECLKQIGSGIKISMLEIKEG